MINSILFIEWIIFIPLFLSALYLFMFAINSHRRSKFDISGLPNTKLHRFLVLFPAYKEDKVIPSSIASFMNQCYPSNLFDVLVISDQMLDETNEMIVKLGAKIIKANYTDSSKAKALQLAMSNADYNSYDAVVIMDADNTTHNNFLIEINNAYSHGYKVMQAHRSNKSYSSEIALLDAISEEINNGIIRKGHNALGLSAALSGSGMVFNAKLFNEFVGLLKTAGEDKELEALILKNRKGPIVYLDNIIVFDEKIEKKEAIKNQRLRWIAAQYDALLKAMPDFIDSLKRGNIDYCDKIIQWMLLPRLIQLGAVFSCSFIFTLLDNSLNTKWYLLSFMQILAMIIPIPKSFFTFKLLKSLLFLPGLTFSMLCNLFKLKNTNKKFIHTEHHK